MRHILVIAAVLALAAGCGGTMTQPGNGPPSESASKAPEPAGSTSATRPPDAYLEVSGSRVRLTLGTYCWGSVGVDGSGVSACADTIAPEMRDDLAKVRIAPGDRVTRQLAFRPSRPIEVTVGDRTQKIPASETASWTVNETGVLSIFIYATPGDVSYAARLVAD